MVSTPCRFLRSFIFSYLVFMSLGVVYMRNASFLYVSFWIITTFMPQYICFSIWLLKLLLNYLCLIQACPQNVLHECILPPIGKILAPHLIQTIAHYLRFTVYLCSAHMWDFPKWDLRILERVHGYLWQHKLQFSSKNHSSY